MTNNREKFFEVMGSLRGFILETECDFNTAVDWVTDQCDWNYLTNSEFTLVSEVFDECST